MCCSCNWLTVFAFFSLSHVLPFPHVHVSYTSLFESQIDKQWVSPSIASLLFFSSSHISPHELHQNKIKSHNLSENHTNLHFNVFENCNSWLFFNYRGIHLWSWRAATMHICHLYLNLLLLICSWLAEHTRSSSFHVDKSKKMQNMQCCVQGSPRPGVSATNVKHNIICVGENLTFLLRL